MALVDELEALRAIGVNHNLNHNRNASDQISGSLSLQINRRLQKKGRNVTLNLNGGLNQNDGDQSSYAQIARDWGRLTAFLADAEA